MKQINNSIKSFMLILFSITFFTNGLFAQCTNNSQYGSATLNTLVVNVVTQISSCSYAGEYSPLNNGVAGATYTVASSAGDYITIRQGSYNGAVVAYGISPVTFTAPAAVNYYAHWNLAGCGTQNSCRITTVMLNLPPPTVSSFSPSSGCALAQTVTINGTGFVGVTAVQFGGVNAQSYTVVSPTQITAIPGNGNTGQISVTNAGGAGNSASTFDVYSAPVITATASNPMCSGTPGTLTGAGGLLYTWQPGALTGQIVNVTPPIGNTTYTVTGTGINGCTNTSTVTATVIQTAASPSSVTATPATICAGGSSNLVSTATAGSTQHWFTVANGGVEIGNSLSGANYSVSPAVTTTYYVESTESVIGITGSQTYSYTGAPQTFVVPAGVNLIQIETWGAQGGGPVGGGAPGLGGYAIGSLVVTPGQNLNIYVGGAGEAHGLGTPCVGGWNGGGGTGIGLDPGSGGVYTGSGGGASDVRVGGNGLGNRIIVAGGGG